MIKTTVYIAIDGDDIGRYIEYLILKNDFKKLNTFSNLYKNQMMWLKNELVDIFEASVVFEGGDSLLLFTKQKLFCLTKLESKIKLFNLHTNKTLSVGIGYTIREAYFALKFAKASGKNCIQKFDDLINE